MITAPMLACETPKDLKALRFPLLGSYKIDGIRAVVMDGVVLSRKLRPIPSTFVQRNFGHLEGFDGELGAGIASLEAGTFYRDTYSLTMTDGSNLPCWFFVFDYFNYRSTFEKRQLCLHTDRDILRKLKRTQNVDIIEQRTLYNVDQVLAMEEEALSRGFEGLILRDPLGHYKMGRSTFREHGMIKLKRTTDGEAEIVGFEERMHNANELKRDALGKAKRSSHKENLIPMDTLGALVCRDLNRGIEFNVGTFKGYTASDLKRMWRMRRSLLGKIIKYQYFGYGIKDRPRHPRLIGFRSKIDL